MTDCSRSIKKGRGLFKPRKPESHSVMLRIRSEVPPYFFRFISIRFAQAIFSCRVSPIKRRRRRSLLPSRGASLLRGFVIPRDSKAFRDLRKLSAMVEKSCRGARNYRIAPSSTVSTSPRPHFFPRSCEKFCPVRAPDLHSVHYFLRIIGGGVPSRGLFYQS